jgi:hypothetical protein
MKTRILGAIMTGLLGIFLAVAEGNAVAANDDRILLFSVPLKCEAVPEIGCGSLSTDPSRATTPIQYFRGLA